MCFSRLAGTARSSGTSPRVRVRVASSVLVVREDEDKGTRADVGEVSMGKRASTCKRRRTEFGRNDSK